MLSFEVSAIDLILVIAVVVLLLLYLKNFATAVPEDKFFKPKIVKDLNKKRKQLVSKTSYAECPRGFGNIRKLGDDNSVSDRCLGCYRIMECYGETK